VGEFTVSGLRYFYDEKRFAEMDFGVGNPIHGTTGFKPAAALSGEYAYWTAYNNIHPASGDPGPEIWRVDLSQAGSAAAELFVGTEAALQPDSVNDDRSTGVRDMTLDRDGNVIAARTNLYAVGNVRYDVGRQTSVFSQVVVRKYDRADGSIMWSSEDVGLYIDGQESGADDLFLGGPGICLAVSDSYVLVAQCGRRVSGGWTVHDRHVWLTLLDVGTGATVGYARLDASDVDCAVDQDCRLYGAAWDPDTGKFWVAGTNVWQNDGTTFPDDYECRLFWVDENNLASTGTADIALDGHTKTIPLGLSYHPAGKLLIPVWHDTAGGGSEEMGLAVYDLTAGTTDHATLAAPNLHFDESAAGSFCEGGNCGIGRTGQRAGWYEQQRENGVADAAAVAPSKVYLCDGKRIWECDAAPASVDATFLTSSDYEYQSITRRANGDIVTLYPWFKDVSGSDVLQVTIQVIDPSDGSVKFSQTVDYTSEAGPAYIWRDVMPYQNYGTANQAEQELPWGPFCVGAAH
jgi:hypothetical protein